MKRLFVVLMLLFVSLNFVACAEKKDSKTRLTKGSGRESAISQTAASGGWSMLNQSSEETELWSTNPDASARAFISNDDKFAGPSQLNTIVMRLQFSGGQIVTQQTMVGLRFYDDWSNPLAYFLGSNVNNRAGSGQRTGNRVVVTFQDFNEDGESLGNVVINGEVQGQRFVGFVQYAGGRLGDFNVSTSQSIFGF